MFCCLAALVPAHPGFVQPGLQMISERDDQYLFINQDSRKPHVSGIIALLQRRCEFRSPQKYYRKRFTILVMSFIFNYCWYCLLSIKHPTNSQPVKLYTPVIPALIVRLQNYLSVFILVTLKTFPFLS
jgi:hypothetical protein